MTRAGPFTRIPRETRAAAVVLALSLVLVGVLAALGLGQTARQREDAETALAARSALAVRTLVARAVRQVEADEQRVAAKLARDEGRAAADRVREALADARLFSTAHLLDARGEPCDVRRPPLVPEPYAVDPAARRRVDELLQRERTDRAAATDAAEALCAELERASPPDAVAVALALECGARSAFREPDFGRAIGFARRTLDRYAAVSDDRGDAGAAEPFGPAASAVLCESLLDGVAVGDLPSQSAFVDAVAERRRGAQRLRGRLSPAAYAVEVADCLRLRRTVSGLRLEHQKALDAILRECDEVDADLAALRTVPRAQLAASAVRNEPMRVPLADGSLVLVLPLGDAEPWAAVAFTAKAAALRTRALLPEAENAVAPPGISIVVRDRTGAAVWGRMPEGPTPVHTYAEESFGLAFPGFTASAVLDDPGVLVRESAAAGAYWLWVLAAAALAAVAAGVLFFRAVLREVRLARMKSDFVSNLSHELRTPLTSLRMFVETLQEGRVRDEAERKECLGVIADETNRLASLVDRVLQFAAFSKGRAPIEPRPGDAGEVVRRSVELFRKRAEAAGAAIEARIEPGLSPAELDRDAVAQVVLNLLDNAVKHAGHDRPRVRVTARRHGAAGGRGTEILVEDDGPGIPERERELVFEEFYRGDDTLSRRTQGAGLGLALSRRIVLAHGGELTVGRSRDLGGAAFRVVLPGAPEAGG